MHSSKYRGKVKAMTRTKHSLAVLTFVGLAWCVVPANADPVTPVTVSNVQVDWSQGEGTPLNSLGGIYYAGPITFTIGGQSVIVWCDDLYNDVYIGSSDQYYETDAHDANAYLYNPALTSAEQTTLDQDIAGLAYEGTVLAKANALTPASGAEIQVAIWELEYPGLQDTDTTMSPTFQQNVQGYINLAADDYNTMVSKNYTYGELESPTVGCVSQGALTYTNVCQTQGQIFVYDPVPEPLTLSLFGAGLVGAFAIRRRKKMAA